MRQGKCPHCGKGPVNTVDSRHDTEWRWRRRVCQHCTVRWSTYEVPAELIGNLAKAVHILTTTRDTLDELICMINEVPLLTKTEELSDELRAKLAMDTRSKR